MRTGVINFTMYDVSKVALCIAAIMQMNALTRGSICGNNRKGVAWLNYHRFSEPPPQNVTAPRPSSDPSYQHYDSRDQAPKASAPGDFTARQTFSRAALFMRTQRGLTACERELIVKAASDS